MFCSVYLYIYICIYVLYIRYCFFMFAEATYLCSCDFNVPNFHTYNFIFICYKLYVFLLVNEHINILTDLNILFCYLYTCIGENGFQVLEVVQCMAYITVSIVSVARIKVHQRTGRFQASRTIGHQYRFPVGKGADGLWWKALPSWNIPLAQL
jgi:hypothetical protein